MAKRITGFLEWAAHYANIDMGCKHGCLYGFCQARAIRFDQATPASWTEPRPLKTKPWTKFKKKVEGRIAFPSSHDITAENLERYLVVAESMLQAGNELLIVTKPHLDCVDRITRSLEPYKGQILFRFTIGSLDDATLKYWEPGAPNSQERLASMRLAYERGFKTSVSCEPLLAKDVEAVGEMVRTFKPFVTDSIWLGRANKLKARVALNRPGDPMAMKSVEELEARWDDEHVRALYWTFKDDPIIKWKDSVKTIMGIPSQEFAGQDI